MRILYLACCLLSCLLLPYLVIAGEQNSFYVNSLNFCKITGQSTNDYEPKKFSPTNNLLRGAGQQVMTCGEKIIVKGRVLDENCVPVSDAKVYLWQVGCDGRYPYKPLKSRINQKLINEDNQSSFQGNGTATTDNNGNFHFITIMPPSSSPHVNVRVSHYRLGKLQASLQLSGNHILDNEIDTSALMHGLDQDNRTYIFDIVMPGTTIKRY